MALDIPAIAAAALVTAWDTAASVLSAATIRFRPTNTYVPATGATTSTWGAEITGKKVFKWEENTDRRSRNARMTEGLDARLSTTKILIRAVDIGAEVPAPNMEIEISGEVWKVEKVNKQPTDTFYIAEVRR